MCLSLFVLFVLFFSLESRAWKRNNAARGFGDISTKIIIHIHSRENIFSSGSLAGKT